MYEHPDIDKEDKILRLTLKKKWFDLIVSGIKKSEFRSKSDWIESRIIDRYYDYVLFTNGYGKDKDWVVLRYNSYKEIDIRHYDEVLYKGGVVLDLEGMHYEIELGVIKCTNIN